MKPIAIRNLLALCVASIMFVGCSSVHKPETNKTTDKQSQADGLPSWVTMPPQDVDMAYGVGSMEIYGNPEQALKRASDFARADLVSRLKVTVSGNTSSSINEFSLNGETRLQKNVSQVVSSKIPTVTLDEVWIAKTYVDDRYAYALAELDRVAAMARLKQQMKAIEGTLTQLAAQPPLAESKLARLQQQLPALRYFAQHDQLAEQYAFISTDRQQPKISDSLTTYRKTILSALKDLQVRLVLLDDGAKIMHGGLAEALTNQGIRLGTDNMADLNFEVSASLDSQQKDGNYYVFANARVNMRDNSGKILSSFAKEARGVSGLQQNALNKASEALAQLLSNELAQTLTDRIQ